jgi:hypothetical protein
MLHFDRGEIVAEDGFKLPGSSYAELAKIIRAYGHAPDEATPKDVSDRAAIDPTQVSRNNGFLLSVGIIEGGNKKTLTPRGRALAKSLDFEMPDEIAGAWRAVVSENDFLRKIVSAVRIRGGMEPSALRSHVAYTAGAAKKPAAMAGAGSVIDALKVAGLLRDEDGKIIATPEGEPASSYVPDVTESSPESVTSRSPVTRAVAIHGQASGVAATIQVQVRIDCKPADLDGLGAKLKALLDELGDAGADTEFVDG